MKKKKKICFQNQNGEKDIYILSILFYRICWHDLDVFTWLINLFLLILFIYLINLRCIVIFIPYKEVKLVTHFNPFHILH